MAKSKLRKDHKKKAMARKAKMVQEKNKHTKLQRDFIMNLIKKEQESGMYNANPTVPPVGPSIDSLPIEGPSI